MSEFNVAAEWVRKKLNKLKVDKSPGPDAIHPRLFPRSPTSTKSRTGNNIQDITEVRTTTTGLEDGHDNCHIQEEQPEDGK